MTSNFVPCLTWVKRGISKSVPHKVQLTQEELQQVIDHSINEFNSVAEKEEVKKEVKDEPSMEIATDDKEIEDEYDLGNYDDEDKDNSNPKGILNSFLKPEDLAAYTNLDLLKSDPYQTQVNDDEFEQLEREDFEIKATDNLLLVGHVEEENSVLEIYVHNEEEDSLYVHHDIQLPAFPVSLEWMDYHPAKDRPGNYVAVGDMTAKINVWNLDVVDLLEPEFVMKKRSKKHKRMGHSDAVLDLGWNKFLRNKLASASADTTICLWDLQTQIPSDVLNLHTGKVQTLQWHPFESQFLLSGCTDGIVNVTDCNTQPNKSRNFAINEEEIERVLWNHFNPFSFLCSTDKGNVHCMDIRTNTKVWTFHAHDEAVTGLTLSATKEGCLITASMDKTVKVWDITEEPKFVGSQKAKLGSIFVAKACPDSTYLIALGGNDPSRTMAVKNILKFTGCLEAYSEDSALENMAVDTLTI